MRFEGPGKKTRRRIDEFAVRLVLTAHERSHGGRMKAPFPWFGGKRDVVDLVWRALGAPKQYIEPFCGSAAMLLGARKPALLEVIGDVNGFVANFWRCVRHQPDEVVRHADYPVSHVDLGARHAWLLGRVPRLSTELQDANWEGDAKVAGWWLWGQCCWIGSGWCEWPVGQIPHVSDAGRGIQAAGKIPHVSDAGRSDLLTSSGLTAAKWIGELSRRLERVRVIHGDWSRCLNSHYGGEGPGTAVFFDPPYLAYEELYGKGDKAVAQAVAEWCAEHPKLRIALAGHFGDYDLPGWSVTRWERKRLTYSGGLTKASEAIWFSPSCLPTDVGAQASLFGAEQ
jgi:hypothetical protein